MNPSPDTKARVLAAVRQEPAPTRAQVSRRDRVLLVVGAALAVVAFLIAGGARPGPRPLPLVIATSAGTAVLAGIALWAGLGRGRSMLGRQRAILIVVGVVSPLLLLVWRSGISSLFEGMTDAWPTRPGFRCMKLSLVVGVLPLLVALFARRRSAPVSPAGAGAALGTAMGLGAAFLVDLWCPVGHAPHVLLGHVLPIIVLACTGALLGMKWLSIRGRRD